MRVLLGRPRWLALVVALVLALVGAGVALALTRGSDNVTGAKVALSGRFTKVAYATTGVASLRGRRLTFRDFRTFSAPGLIVLVLVPGKHDTSLGRLKSTSGTQSYTIPDGLEVTPGTRVAVFCTICKTKWGVARLRPVA